MNVFVSNLMFSFTEEDLKKTFSPFGEVVSCKIVTDKFSGTSKGFGFVEMADSNAGMEAIARLDGKLINGRPIAVSIARERTRPEGRSYR